MGARKKPSKAKKKASPEQAAAARYINEWLSIGAPPSAADGDGFLPAAAYRPAERLVFEFHSHSKCSDGYLSPTALVERAHRKGVKVLALTDHDTMAGVPEATEAAGRFGIKIIPGVEISAMYSPRDESGIKELVHILAYYGSSGPARYEELNGLLTKIRDGRYLRAESMLLKLKRLKMPLTWEHVAKIAGAGVAPGRVHVARAMVEAGHVENLKQAFNRYLYDNGPAYATGSEPLAETVVQLISQTGGISALAHPWALKNPVGVVRSLKGAGLHAMEVYRSDGKVDGLGNLADTYNLLKLGGSDYHGKGEHGESDLGSVNLPIVAVHKFFKMARPVWCNAVKEILRSFINEPSEINLEKVIQFGKLKFLKGTSPHTRDVVNLCLSSWLTNEERKGDDFESIRQTISEMSEGRILRFSGLSQLLDITTFRNMLASRILEFL